MVRARSSPCSSETNSGSDVTEGDDSHWDVPAPGCHSTSCPVLPRFVCGRTRSSEGANLAGKVIVHLSLLGRVGNDEVGRLGFTQAGMSDALGIRQGSLTKVLSRLEAAQVIEVDRRHVQRQPRRIERVPLDLPRGVCCKRHSTPHIHFVRSCGGFRSNSELIGGGPRQDRPLADFLAPVALIAVRSSNARSLLEVRAERGLPREHQEGTARLAPRIGARRASALTPCR